MKSYQKIIAGGIIIAGLVGLSSCDMKQEEKPQKKDLVPSYFAKVPMFSDSGMAMVSGDFDGDGDLDLIVGARTCNSDSGRLYIFYNDGEGNFSQ